MSKLTVEISSITIYGLRMEHFSCGPYYFNLIYMVNEGCFEYLPKIYDLCVIDD